MGSGRGGARLGGTSERERGGAEGAGCSDAGGRQAAGFARSAHAARVEGPRAAARLAVLSEQVILCND